MSKLLCYQKKQFKSKKEADYWLATEQANNDLISYDCKICNGAHVSTGPKFRKRKRRKNRDRIKRRKREYRMNQIHSMLMQLMEVKENEWSAPQGED